MKVALVTGGGKGIGAEIARRLVAENWHVVIAEVHTSHKEFSLKDRDRLLFVKTDVKSEASVKAMIKKAYKHFGRIDALINNAGILPDEKTHFEQTSLKDWNEFIATNLTGAFLCSKYALPYLRKQKGSIVNIASTRSLQSMATDAAYTATKGGLVALTHTMAVDLGPDIRVNAISPGWIDTGKDILKKKDHEQHPAGRVGKPEDIAAMVAFLISEQAGFITGANLVIDGGMTIKMIYV